MYPSFINAVLKKIIKEKESIKNLNITIENLPVWFQKEIKKDVNINLEKFLESFFYEPSLHFVFKDQIFLQKFNEEFELSTQKSAFMKSKKKIPEFSNYKDGNWWVQNYSSMLPILLGINLKKKSILDLCAAPGGKAFQVLAEDNNIILNDVSKKRIKILKENLLRLNYNTKINNFNALVFPEKKKYDVVLLDAPCSATGTIRGNPEIFFKKKPPNLISLFELQKNLLEKAANLLNPNGIIVYMVCSFPLFRNYWPN